MGIQLNGVDGPLAGKYRELTDGIYIVGRSPDCDVLVDDPNVSRRHAVIRIRDGGAEIEDTNSKNGTWVNGSRVLQSKLGDGDTLKLGDCTFGVAKVREPAAPQPEAVPAPVLPPVYSPPPEPRPGYAGFWIRLAARLLDFMIVTLPYCALWGFVLIIAGRGTTHYLVDRPMWLNIMISLFYVVAFAGYLTWMDGASGQTLGRKAVGIRVTTESGSSITNTEALLRHLLHGVFLLLVTAVVCAVPAFITGLLSGPNSSEDLLRAFVNGLIQLGGLAAVIYLIFQYVLLAADPMKRGWHDKIIKTVVMMKR